MDLVELDTRPHVDIDDEDEDFREHAEFGDDASVDSFRDEPPIVHDEYPKSDGEGDDDRCWREEQNVRRGDGNFYQGQTFLYKYEFTSAVLDHALKTGRNIRQYRYDKNKLGYNCVGGNCEWRIYCTIRENSDRWEVKVYNDKHTCVPNGQCDMLKVPIIARLFVDKIREEPEYYIPMKIEETIREKWKINVSRPQCQAARNKALRWIEKEYDEQFQRLRDYGAEILNSNPNSTVDIETLTNDEGLDVFDRLYVCFDVVRRTWRDTCRPLIGVDGCFLRGKMKGQLVVALGRDANNAIYPIAWGVVQVENTANWLWFVKKIKADLFLEDGEGYVLVSDRQKV